MDSQIFTEPPLPINCERFQCTVGIFIACTYIYLYISRGQSIIILDMGWGTIGEGMNTFQRTSCIKLSGDCFNTGV